MRLSTPRAVLTPGVKGVKTSCFWFAEHMQCDARVDGREQQSTHASMPRVAQRTRIRTGTVRRAARRVRKRKTCCHAKTDVSVERRALTRVGFVERCTCASVDIRGDRRILASADARHQGDACVYKALWPSITLFGCMRPTGQQTRAVKSRFLFANLCFFGLCLEGPCGALSTRCHSSLCRRNHARVLWMVPGIACAGRVCL